MCPDSNPEHPVKIANALSAAPNICTKYNNWVLFHNKTGRSKVVAMPKGQNALVHFNILKHGFQKCPENVRNNRKKLHSVEKRPKSNLS